MSSNQKLLAHFTTTNDIPNLHQRACLNAEHTQIKSALYELDAELERLEQDCSVLLSKRQRFRSLASILVLPNDVLEKIFFNFIPEDVRSGHQVAQVCRSWRQVILHMPPFWTELVLPGCGNQGNFYELWMHLCHYTTRAQDLPVSLTTRKAPEDLLNLLSETIFGRLIASWKTISFPSSRSGHIHQILNYYRTYPDEADHITAISLTAPQLDDYDEDEDDYEFDLVMFQWLSHLQLDFTDLQFIQDRFCVYWGSLSPLILCAEATCEQYLELLSECHSLEFLSITPQDDSDDAEEGDMVELTQLKTLTIESPNHPSTLFERLSTPILEELFLKVPNPLDDDNEAIHHFLDRLSAAGSLCVLHCYGHHDPTFDFFDNAGLRNLTHLRLRDSYRSPEPPFNCEEVEEDESIFNMLTQSGEQDDWLPWLEVLKSLIIQSFL